MKVNRSVATDYCGRSWLFGDEVCGYKGCGMPWRTHFHYLHDRATPEEILYYDELENDPRFEIESSGEEE